MKNEMTLKEIERLRNEQKQIQTRIKELEEEKITSGIFEVDYGVFSRVEGFRLRYFDERPHERNFGDPNGSWHNINVFENVEEVKNYISRLIKDLKTLNKLLDEENKKQGEN